MSFKISVIIPTRDMSDHLHECLNSIHKSSINSQLEIIIIDNCSTDIRAVRLLNEMSLQKNISIVNFQKPFNFSAMINTAVKYANGGLICLLNNDTEVIAPDSFESMAELFRDHSVGVVGSLLFFPDGSIQHAGDLVGGSCCVRHDKGEGWVFRGEDDSLVIDPETREVDAITGACLMTRRDLFLRLGGMDEQSFPVAFNDTDYCLRVRKEGFKVICTSRARFIHHEMATRGPTWKPWDLWRLHCEKRAFHKRWLDTGSEEGLFC